MEIVVCNKYKLLKKKSKGILGEQIYLGIDIITGKNVLIKRQKNNKNYDLLQNQGKLLLIVQNDTTMIDRGIPQVYHVGIQGQYSILVMEMLGKSLKQLLQFRQSNTFTLKTTLMLLDQMFRRIQLLHTRGIIHRNIQLSNFVMGSQFHHPRKGLHADIIKNNNHIAYQQGCKMFGTPRWVSINIHMGIKPTRRDDLISLMYVVVYMLKGKLPWQHQLIVEKQQQQFITKQQQYKRILMKKIEYRNQLLFQNLPKQLMQISQQINELQFSEQPNYEQYKKLIQQCIKQYQIDYNYKYDWI